MPHIVSGVVGGEDLSRKKKWIFQQYIYCYTVFVVLYAPLLIQRPNEAILSCLFMVHNHKHRRLPPFSTVPGTCRRSRQLLQYFIEPMPRFPDCRSLFPSSTSTSRIFAVICCSRMIRGHSSLMWTWGGHVASSTTSSATRHSPEYHSQLQVPKYVLWTEI